MTQPIDITNSLDNSRLGQLVIKALNDKNTYEAGEAAYRNALVDRVVQVQARKHENPQKVLDSQFFNSMSTSDKIKFINTHRDLLARHPKYNYGAVLEASASSGGLAGLGTLLHQVATHTAKPGGPGFAVNKWAVGGAIGMGALIGAMISAKRERADYKKDLDTHKSIDDAISILVERGLRPVPTKSDYLGKVRTSLEDAPLLYGKSLSAIDFSKLQGQ